MTAISNIQKHTKPQGGLTLAVHAADRYDPTRTTALRNKYAREMGKRFRELRGEIYRAIVLQDVFGLSNDKKIGKPLVINVQRGQFDFPRSQHKVAVFMEWLEGKEQQGIFQLAQGQQIGSAVESNWQDIYLEDSYKRGVIRSRHELIKAGYPVQSLEQSGGIDAVLGGPMHVDRMGLVYTRAFNELKGITADMNANISSILAQGLADGDHPRLLARKINATISGLGLGELGITDTLGRFIPAERRARMLARTEVIRAHHMANVQEMENWGVEGVRVKVEWRTAGYNVCEICQALEGREFTLTEIRTMIPRHPNCRCMALPVDYSDVQRAASAEVDPVADSFKNEADSRQYLEDKKQYDEWFKTTRFDENDLKEFNEIAYGKESMARNNFMRMQLQNKMQDDFPNIYRTMVDWQGSTHGMRPMRMKYVASKLEKRAGRMVYPDNWDKAKIAQMKSRIKDSALSSITEQEYIRARAFNQSYMQWKGLDKKLHLVRGTDGDLGKIYKDILRDDTQFQRKRWHFNEAPLSGYTTEKHVADRFGTREGGFTMRTTVDRKDVFMHRELFSKVTVGYLDEFEYIILSGRKELRMKNIDLGYGWGIRK